ncbi:hypothetical protein GIB67_004110 [Kingdonia uniflora]|uniref:Disease resistance protein At4g27190-like leucine-rich repeats domain-containing protein n=1 Tax=Kingdonia uniflora TaxID=39325 RepID=A0A7J7MNS5_9MAGN|nr:hypothetical protein GIB67_040575 [Kingdonia uniflora]KAF6169718.1 hypothetical protein GIB67_004110 [Kingdonia uniflora]
MSGLTNLKMLDLSYNKNLACIPPKVISRLSSLEELYMIDSFGEWEIEGTGDNASLAEVVSLAKLTSLYLDVENEKWLSTDIGPSHHWEKLEKFYIRVGYSTWWTMTPKSKRCVRLSTRSDSFPVAAWVNVLMGRTYAYDLRLERCEGLKNVLQLNPKGRFYNLNSLTIGDSREMEYVVNVEEQVPDTMFPNLEILKVVVLPKLKVIWNGPLLGRSFEKLKVLEIYGCGKLVNVMPSLLWTMLQNLEQIDIRHCPSLEKVFESDGFEDGSGSIFKLRSIELRCLDSLTSIWKGAIPLIRLENLKILYVEDCPNLRLGYLFHSVAFAQRFQQLEELTVIECQSFIKLIAKEDEEEGMEIKSCPINFIAFPPIFFNLKVLLIIGCNDLKYIFPIRIFQGLLQLEEFTVSRCYEMENLTEVCQEEKDGSMTIRLPHLRIVQLDMLPRLSSFFSHGVLLDCPSLEKLKIYDCPNLKRLPFLDETMFPNLEVLKLKLMKELKAIWNGPLVERSFEKMRVLRIEDCNNLVNVLPSLLSTRLQNLEDFRVHDCNKMEELFEFEECEEEEDGSMTIRLPHLSFLSLRNLPTLTSFFSHRSKLPRVFLDCPSLEELMILDCRNLKRLPFGPQSTPKLTEFQIDPNFKAQLQQLLPLRRITTNENWTTSHNRKGTDPGIVPCNPHLPEHEDEGHASGLPSVLQDYHPQKIFLLFSCALLHNLDQSLCYGKLEAGVLTFVIPTVLLRHLKGLMDDGVKLSLLCVRVALFVVFAVRNFSQPIKKIPDGFFEGMKRLATLDLSGTGIKYQPQSLLSLNNCLRSLYLGNCWRLKDVSLIGNLKTLEILSLQHTGISMLPEEIGGLTDLKMLDLFVYQESQMHLIKGDFKIV